MKKVYKSKVLLFGEYSVIHGSDALAMPSGLFSGKWSFEEGKTEVQAILKKIHAYLSKLKLERVHFQAAAFWEDLNRQLIFDSTIPIGYGVGSSGALCAAIFDRYYQKDDVLSLLALKNILGKMECFFHGSSSGLDPLITYLEQAIWIHQDQVEAVHLPKPNLSYHLFLLDTGIPRKTEPLVSLYLEKYKSNPSFQIAIKEELSTLNNLSIQQYLNNNQKALFDNFHRISDFQWKYFKEMIPKNCQGVWQKGLKNDVFKIKLCGAGGGGFLLGMTQDRAKIEQLSFRTLAL